QTCALPILALSCCVTSFQVTQKKRSLHTERLRPWRAGAANSQAGGTTCPTQAGMRCTPRSEAILRGNPNCIWLTGILRGTTDTSSLRVCPPALVTNIQPELGPSRGTPLAWSSTRGDLSSMNLD